MPRTVRIGFPGAVYHVICGGDRREPVFLERFRWDYAYQSGSRGLVSQIQTAAEWKVIDSTTWWDSQPGAVSRVQAWETTRDVLDSVENLGAGNSTLSKYDYAVNNRGQRTQVVKTGSAFAANAFHAWGYDSKGQVTSANKFLGTNTGNTSQPVNSEHFGFNYDNIGNRNWASVAGNVTANYTAGLSNQYSGIISGNTTENPVHDADGNPIEDADYLYTWDAENRLVQVERKSDSVTWTYAYDAEGRRYWAGGGSVERFFVYDGWNVIRDRQVWSGGESSDYYVWGLDLSGTIHGAGGVGGLLMWLQPQTVPWNNEPELRPHWYTYDGNGNVSDLVSGEWDFTNFLDPTFSSALENHYEYGPFGEIVTATDNRPENPFKFSTKWHEGNGLVYYGYRFYDSRNGRWLSRDPIGERGGETLTRMLENSVLSLVDYLGLALWDSPITIVPGAPGVTPISGTGARPTFDPDQAAIDHFFEGNGSPLQLGSSHFRPTKYKLPLFEFGAKQLRKACSQKCPHKVSDINSFDTGMSAVGYMSFKIKGSVTSSDGTTWDFTGTIEPSPETLDFRPMRTPFTRDGFDNWSANSVAAGAELAGVIDAYQLIPTGPVNHDHSGSCP